MVSLLKEVDLSGGDRRKGDEMQWNCRKGVMWFDYLRRCKVDGEGDGGGPGVDGSG